MTKNKIHFSCTDKSFRLDSLQNFRLYYIPSYSLDFARK